MHFTKAVVAWIDVVEGDRVADAIVIIRVGIIQVERAKGTEESEVLLAVGLAVLDDGDAGLV